MSKYSYRWQVHIEIKSGFNPVSILLYASSSLRDAFDYLATRQHLITKKRKVYLKELGKKPRYTLDYTPVEDDESEDTHQDFHDKFRLAQRSGVRRL